MASELRYNHVKKCWVSVSTGRAMKPNDFPTSKIGAILSQSAEHCPFCEGREGLTPRELLAVRPPDTAANTPGWQVRAIPNKFSAFEMEPPFLLSEEGSRTSSPSFGDHEVVVETPRHDLDLSQLSSQHLRDVLSVLRARYHSLAQDARFRYIHIYKNSGVYGGASMIHSHSQIIATPFENTANIGMPEYYERTGRCIVCDTIDEPGNEERLIHVGEHFIIVCPFAPRFAHETWIVPRLHQEHFSQINEVALTELAVLLGAHLGGMLDTLGQPSYNLTLVTSPVNVDYRTGYHWYIEVSPKLLVPSAVETGADIFLNFAAPEVAAPLLREGFQTQLKQRER